MRAVEDRKAGTRIKDKNKDKKDSKATWDKWVDLLPNDNRCTKNSSTHHSTVSIPVP